MTATPNMSLVLPTDHGSSDTWDVILDQVFNLIDSHDHSTGKGVKVPSAALNINADVAWTGFSITGLNAVDFTPVAAGVVAGFAGALFVNSSDNELYYRTTAGSNVKFTSGAALNVAAFTGGFGGDYAAVGALADFDDASDTYRFRQQVGSAVRQFGKASHADLSLFEYKASGVTPVPSNAVTLKSPAALAGSYSITMPTALPASTQRVSMSSSGQLATGQLVATLCVPPLAAWEIGGAAHVRTGDRITTGASTNPVYYGLPVTAGDIITAFTLYVKKQTSGATTISARLGKTVGSTGTLTLLGAGVSSAANNPGFITLAETLGAAATVAAGEQYFLIFTPVTGTANDITLNADIAITR